MNKRALILAAHGSRHEPAANAQIRRIASVLEARGGFDAVVAAFHQGAPTYGEVLDAVDAGDVTVVPVMTSQGFYCDEFLPAQLAKNRRFRDVRIRQTPPIGVHRDMARIVSVRIADICSAHDLDPRQVDAAVVGHGAQRNPNSRRATQNLAAALQSTATVRRVAAFFLDEPPGVEQIPIVLDCATIVVIPFLISPGPHVRRDIPRRLGVGESVDRLPREGAIGNRRNLIDDAVGTYPAIVDVIWNLATSPLASRHRLKSPIRIVQIPMWHRPMSHRPMAGANRLLAGATSSETVPNVRPAACGSGGATRRGVLRLGTRGSRLALRQADIVARALHDRGTLVEIVELSTLGDRITDRAIGDLPSSAPFCGEIEDALRRGEIDLAVHSRKDLNVAEPDDLRLAAILPRGLVEECLVSRHGRRLDQLPPGAIIGTSSPRRAAQLLAQRPDLKPATMRGPVEGRVAQVRAGRFDAAILAAAGLARLDMLAEAAETFSLEAFLPAPAQGALAVQVRGDDDATWTICAALDDAETRRAVAAELEFLRPFEFDAMRIAAALATVDAGTITLRARLLSPDGTRRRDVMVTGTDPHETAAATIDAVTSRESQNVGAVR
jgi:hydroxymethylbilane synthase